MSDPPERTSEGQRVEYTSEASTFLAERRAATHAAFFLPYLKSGMTLLDCGCGPGSVTADLAAIVHPGEVIGIDIDERHILLARERASRQTATNLRFDLGDIMQLPFPDEAFDAVFVHGVVEYLIDSVGALKEIHRVLKSGGMIGTRHGDWGGFLLFPNTPHLHRFFSLFQQLMIQNGGDPHFGRKQASALRQAGFARMKTSASYDCWTATREAREGAAHFLAAYCASDVFARPLVSQGWANSAELAEIASSIHAWGTDEDAFAAEAWAEAVAWKA